MWCPCLIKMSKSFLSFEWGIEHSTAHWAISVDILLEMCGGESLFVMSSLSSKNGSWISPCWLYWIPVGICLSLVSEHITWAWSSDSSELWKLRTSSTTSSVISKGVFWFETFPSDSSDVKYRRFRLSAISRRLAYRLVSFFFVFLLWKLKLAFLFARKFHFQINFEIKKSA